MMFRMLLMMNNVGNTSVIKGLVTRCCRWDIIGLLYFGMLEDIVRGVRVANKWASLFTWMKCH